MCAGNGPRTQERKVPMSTHIISTRRILAAIGVGGVLAAGLINAPAANATPESDFFDLLMAGGITVFNAGAAVDRGYAICEAFNTMDGNDVAATILASADPAEVPTIDVARVWVIASGIALCPWHYHPERNQGGQVRA